jgi:hypothetical protein
MHFAIDRRLRSSDEELNSLLRTLRRRELSAFGINLPLNNPNGRLKIRRITWDKPSRQFTPNRESCLGAGQLERAFTSNPTHTPIAISGV